MGNPNLQYANSNGYNSDGYPIIESSATSEHAYGNYPEYQYLQIDSTATDTAAGTAIFASGDITIFNQLDFAIVTAPTTGIEIYVSYDGVNFETASTNRLSVIDSATGLKVNATSLAGLTAGSFSIRSLKAKKIEIRQVGSGVAGKIRGSLGVA